MSESYPGLNTYQLIGHLEHDFEGIFDRVQVQSCVVTALSDLRGSICAEALNEMAYKLASYRLRARLSYSATSRADDLIGAAHT